MLGYNLYPYCKNNPVNFADPTGEYYESHVDDRNYLDDWMLEGGGASGISNYAGYYGPGSAYYNYSVYTSTSTYDAYLGGYYSSGLTSAMTNPSYYVVPNAVTVVDSMATPIRTSKGFDTFDKLKKHLGSAGEDSQWHHLVEQCQIKRSGFSPKQIHNTTNVVPVNSKIHGRISGFYSSKQPFTDGLTVREWLTGQSFQKQYDFGIKIYLKYVKEDQ